MASEMAVHLYTNYLTLNLIYEKGFVEGYLMLLSQGHTSVEEEMKRILHSMQTVVLMAELVEEGKPLPKIKMDGKLRLNAPSELDLKLNAAFIIILIDQLNLPQKDTSFEKKLTDLIYNRLSKKEATELLDDGENWKIILDEVQSVLKAAVKVAA